MRAHRTAQNHRLRRRLRMLTDFLSLIGTSRNTEWSFPMNTISRVLSTLALCLSIPLANAHDPSEHAKESNAAKAGPDCAAMKAMDHSKMDPNDPVMKAMNARCGDAAMHHEETSKPAATAADVHDHGSH